MISISDINEVTDYIETSKKCTNIETENQMSDLEVDSFWKTEFENVRNDKELNSYDRLQSESFNRSTEEIDIDFDIDEELLLTLENFKPEKWEVMNEAQRMVAIKVVVQETAERLGIDKVPNVALYDGDINDCGYFNPDSNEINLNRNLFSNPIELLDTAMHELRHAFQRIRADKSETWEDKLYAYNYDNYITPFELPDGNYLFFTDYMKQYVEVDARAFASKITEALNNE